MSDSNDNPLPARTRITPKRYEDIVEEANSKSQASRGRSGERKRTQKPRKLTKIVSNDMTPIDPAILDLPATENIDFTTVDSGILLPATPGRELSVLQRHQSVVQPSIEYRTPTPSKSPSVAHILRSSTPQMASLTLDDGRSCW